MEIKEISEKMEYDRTTIARILSANEEYSIKESNRRAHLGTGKSLSKAVLQLDKKNRASYCRIFKFDRGRTYYWY
jgi:hypothetical protein